jgi:dephospho-CoA kinase
MRELIFADGSAKQRLEAILHPMIGIEARAQVMGSAAPYVMLVVPLLLERDAYRDMTRRVAVVDCSEATQIRRTMQRSAISADAVSAIMAAQLPRAQRLTKADDVINNDGGEDELRRQVAALHVAYLKLAAAHHAPGPRD